MSSEPMIATAAVDLSLDNDEVQYPTHVRVDFDALYIDIHVGDSVFATMIPLASLAALMDLVGGPQVERFGAPSVGREHLN